MSVWGRAQPLCEHPEGPRTKQASFLSTVEGKWLRMSSHF